MKRKILKAIVCMLLVFAMIFDTGYVAYAANNGTNAGVRASEGVGITCVSHVQSKGWLSPTKNGMLGTVGQGLRLEAFKLDVPANSGLGIKYRAHVQGIGWMPYVKNGSVSGTVGQGRRIEAVQMELTGANADKYDIYYRAHVQSLGWMNWAKNGDFAGTAGLAKRLEAIEIKILPKNSEAPQGSGMSFQKKQTIDMYAHVQSYGWKSPVSIGNVLGTTGQGKRLEAIRLNPVGYDFDVEYKTHIQGIGWTGYVKNGELSGTVGQGRRLEAVCIRLSGIDADKYDIYYRAHVQGSGWLDWAKNGEEAGSVGAGLRMEALDVRLVKKGETSPGGTAFSLLSDQSISYRSNVATLGWQDYVSGKNISGTIGKRLGIRQIQIDTTNKNLGIQYSVYENGSWSGYSNCNLAAGSPDKDIEAVRIRLTGEAAKYYDVWYCVHSATFGWLDWTKNDSPAGSTKVSKNVQAIKILIQPKGKSAPGNTRMPYRDTLYTEVERLARAKLDEIGWNIEAAFQWASGIPYKTLSETVPSGYAQSEWYAIYGFKNGCGNCYSMAATFMYMLKQLGVENVYFVRGYVPNRSGKLVTHGWLEVEKDGQIYVCDPNFVHNGNKGGYMFKYGTPGTWRYTDYKRVD